MKSLFKSAAFTFALTLTALQPSYAQNNQFTPGPIQPAAPRAVKELSSWLTVFQSGLKKHFGVDTVYIGGGSSRAILDTIYQNKMPDMRDLDVFVVLNKEVTFENAKKMGQLLESPELGEFALKDLRPRPRTDEKLLPDMQAALNYNAGYGFFWLKGENIFDLSVYHSQHDLSLNGILNFDMVMIPLTNQSLEKWFNKNKTKTAEQLIKDHAIVDDHGGYIDWLKKEGKVVHPLHITADPYTVAIRLTRSFAKIGRIGLPLDLNKTLNVELAHPPKNRLQIIRNLEKMLEDNLAYSELKTLQSVGFFKIYPELDQYILKTSPQELKKYLVEFEAQKTSRTPLIASLYEALNIKGKSSIIDDIELVHPKWAQHEKQILVEKQTGRQRIGIFTGVFNPIHLGHIEVIKNAIKAGQLDKLYLMPTPATTHNEKPIAWEYRLEMARLTTKDIPQVQVIDKKYLEYLNINTGEAIKQLQADLGDNSYVQIMGLDSFERYHEAGRYNKDAKNELLVMARGSSGLPLTEEQIGSNLIYFDRQKTENFSEENRSSTQIRNRLENGESITNLVSPEVEKYILKNGLYQTQKIKACKTIFEASH